MGRKGGGAEGLYYGLCIHFDGNLAFIKATHTQPRVRIRRMTDTWTDRENRQIESSHCQGSRSAAIALHTKTDGQEAMEKQKDRQADGMTDRQINI